MNKNKAYHKAYLNKYNKTNSSSETNNSSKNVFSFLIFISLPFKFTIVLNFLLLVNKDNEPKIVLNKFNNFSYEIIYNNIIGDDALDAKIKNTNNPLFFQDRAGKSKFEKVTLNYNNNLSNKSGLSKTTLKNIS